MPNEEVQKGCKQIDFSVVRLFAICKSHIISLTDFFFSLSF